MREVWFCLVNCVNCGKQTMIDLKNPEDNCQFCGKNARKKEVIMAEKEGTIDRAKYEAMGRLKRSKWIKEHLEEIMVDIRSMSKDEVVEKWPFGPSTYGKLKRIHAPEVIGQPAPTRVKEYKEPRPKPGEFYIVITEGDLAKLDDDDFGIQWVILGRIIKNRLKRDSQSES